jgi:hypothetical protein
VFGDDLSSWKTCILLILTLPLTKEQEPLQKRFPHENSDVEAQ